MLGFDDILLRAFCHGAADAGRSLARYLIATQRCYGCRRQRSLLIVLPLGMAFPRGSPLDPQWVPRRTVHKLNQILWRPPAEDEMEPSLMGAARQVFGAASVAGCGRRGALPSSAI